MNLMLVHKIPGDPILLAPIRGKIEPPAVYKMNFVAKYTRTSFPPPLRTDRSG